MEIRETTWGEREGGRMRKELYKEGPEGRGLWGGERVWKLK